jgi:hypothetical protein
MTVRRLTADYDFALGHGLGDYAVEAESVAQRVETRLRTFLGEWFLDTGAGVPWLQGIEGGKPVDLPFSEAQIKAAIIETDGVLELSSFSLAFDPASRRLSVAAVVRTDFGSVENINTAI